MVEIDYNPERPPDVFFDTNVLLGLGVSGINSLQHLQSKRGFRFRYSMVNFVELVSHLDDIPSEKIQNPFKRYQAPFKKMARLFELSVLPSAEMRNGSGWLDSFVHFLSGASRVLPMRR